VTSEIRSAAQRGWKLFPVRVRGKLPLIDKWPARASSDPAMLEEWASKYRGCNWGIATGQPSGVFVIDVDGDAGRASLADLKRQGYILPETLTVTTGRSDGGEHRYFRMPPGADIRNDQNGKIGAHIDVRGTGGFVVAVGSTHKSGRIYCYIDPHAGIADAPEWLTERLTTRPIAAHVDARKLGKGRRTQSLVSLAGWLNTRGVKPEQMEAILQAKNAERCSPPLPEEKIRTMVQDICRRYPTKSPDFTQETQDTQGNTRYPREMSKRESNAEAKALLNLPLEKYLKQIIDFTAQMENSPAWNSPLFKFARFCKAHPVLSDLKDHEAMAAVEKALRTFEELPADRNPWDYYFPAAGSADEAQIDFLHCWTHIRNVPFQDVLGNALQLAKEKPLYSSTLRGDLYRRFINLSAWLQLLMGNQPIFLPCRKLSPLFGCSHTTIGQLAQMATKDGLLVIVGREHFSSTDNRKAREYQFNLNLLTIEGNDDESDRTVSPVSASTE
jgi:Bifunctional DNA primase/polymerase, N-terminal